MSVKNSFFILCKPWLIMLLMVLPAASQAQSKLKIGPHQYRIERKKVANEWNTKDEIKTVFLIRKGTKEKILSYYAYKDEGGDCNNLFWNKASIKVRSDTLIVTVHHFQKTGIDPITEWERISYRINSSGKPLMVEHLYKKFGSDEWKQEEEWYK